MPMKIIHFISFSQSNLEDSNREVDFVSIAAGDNQRQQGQNQKHSSDHSKC